MQQAPTSCAPSTCLVPGLAESSGESWTTPLKVLEVCAAVTAAVHTSTPNRARQLVIACSPRCLTWPWMASAAWRTRRAVVLMPWFWIPPKSSIAYIKVTRTSSPRNTVSRPLGGGGRIEICTKPGQKSFHGALFTTNGSPWENARDPFSTPKAAIGNNLMDLSSAVPFAGLARTFSPHTKPACASVGLAKRTLPPRRLRRSRSPAHSLGV